MLHQAILRFNGGELSPYLRYTLDIDKHASGSARMENFLPQPFGGFRKRPGTLHLRNLDAFHRLAAFTYSGGDSVVMAFSSSSLSILFPDGSLSIKITADFGDPMLLQFCQINDILYITHPEFHPRQLLYSGPGSWVLQDIPWSSPPMLDENMVEDLTIETSFPDNSSAAAWASATVYPAGTRVTYSGKVWAANKAHTSTATNYPGGPNAKYNAPVQLPNGATVLVSRPLWSIVWLEDAAVPDQSISLIASGSLWDPGHVGSYWRISKERSLESFEVDLKAISANDGTFSDPIVIQGSWEFKTFGTWNGTFTVQRLRAADADWEDVRIFQADGDRNVAIEGEEPDRVLMRIGWDHDSAGSGGPRGVLSATSGFITGLVRITDVADATHATATVIRTVEKTVTQYWTEGAFSTYQGFPAALSVHERRLVFGNTRRNPLALWFSASDDLVNFQQGTEDDDSIYLILAATRQDPIRWIASQRRLFVGTAGGEWVFGSDNADDPVTPSNLLAREHSGYGSSEIPALRIRDAIFFVERQGRRLREFAWVLERQSYDAADLTRLAEHITEGGLVQMAWQANREPVLWCIRTDGTLLAFHYNRAETLAAWSRHTTSGGQFRSVAVLRNDAGDDDVYVTVERAGAWHLEKFASGQQYLQEIGDLAAMHQVDSGVSAPTSGPSHTVAVPAHLEGKTLSVLADGIAYSLTVSGGLISLPQAASSVHAGLAVSAVMQLLPLDIQTENGPTLARIKQARELVLNLYRSFGGSVHYDGEDSQPWSYTLTSNDTDLALPAYTGWMPMTLTPAHVQDLVITILHNEPWPFTCRAAIVEWHLQEP